MLKCGQISFNNGLCYQFEPVHFFPLQFVLQAATHELRNLIRWFKKTKSGLN